MKTNVKKLYENMKDLHRFAVVFLAIGAFFYLGVIIPSDKSELDQYIMMGSATSFLIVSIILFYNSKRFRTRLLETEEGQEYIAKK
ncbi:YrhC family protein [Bacillus massilinigeriensis]|uniref:YrhC family protein n=1 Tax=Bacillus massilionigeriensis TaxID=1805475 RepID=UPI00096ADD84|nr:YrhC family protein [Bacillus massilionigeriensis]